jgi:urea carboxylase
LRAGGTPGAPLPAKVLVANRGEIACRILRTLERLAVPSVAVFSDPDAGAPHVRLADEAVALGGAAVGESYLRPGAMLDAARASGAVAIHPGYGLLSENAEFAAACDAAGVTFIGPTPAQIRDFGMKDRARALAEAAGVPVLAGSPALASARDAAALAARLGFPLLLKASAGGGGIGMRLCRDPAALERDFESVQRLATAHFGNGAVFLERFLERARHVEVQIFGDGAGQVVSLGTRDCSLQRRHQKLVEEAPAAGLASALVAALEAAACELGCSVAYRSAGTVEFLVDADAGTFHFLEVNTRLQVEHCVTEEICGVDLVEWMVRLAAGDAGFLRAYRHAPRGHAIEVRLYAEDPAAQFRPSAGTLTAARLPAEARVESWVEPGTEISPFYDPLLAKIVSRGETRAEALARLAAALNDTELAGLPTNLAYLRAVIAWPEFAAHHHHTRSLDGFEAPADAIEVVAAGDLTTVQDYPGRLGHWDVGVPPSGPMDALAFRLGNRILGNADGAAGLELTVRGPSLHFRRGALVCLTGAPAEATLDGRAVPMWQVVHVPAGATLAVGAIPGPGTRAYLLVRGGLDVPPYLGSRSTFTLGGFGGHGGRALRTGDVLPLGAPDDPAITGEPALDARPAAALAIAYSNAWTLRVLDGPHGSPEFFTREDIARFHADPFRVHYQSARTGVRLTGPSPAWARADGGEAGLHPSNIHDTAYSVGSIDYTGDMPVILGPDGPSLGGFVCPAVVIEADRWKLGQLRPGDEVRFTSVGYDEALALAAEQEDLIARRAARPAHRAWLARHPVVAPSGVLAERPAGSTPEVTYRQSGDRALLVEYGPMRLDIELRVRVQLLYEAIRSHVDAGEWPGIVDLTPGVRSLQVHYDPSELSRGKLLDRLQALEDGLGDGSDVTLPTRIIRMPLSWDDPAVREAIAKYMRVVRDDAPWCPSNIEFIRRINGLASEDEVRRIVFEASYLVLGLGDVYLGAPVATPLDPRHRLVTTKYNPARTWTPENAVGIGGAYLCVYGMEGPGGYQFVGRTVPVWNTWERWRAGTPWLLRFFDQIRFFPVEPDELLAYRAGVRQGRLDLEVEEAVFDLRAYREFLAANADGIETFRSCQQAAFAAERQRWRASGRAVRRRARGARAGGASECAGGGGARGL